MFLSRHRLRRERGGDAATSPPQPIPYKEEEISAEEALLAAFSPEQYAEWRVLHRPKNAPMFAYKLVSVVSEIGTTWRVSVAWNLSLSPELAEVEGTARAISPQGQMWCLGPYGPVDSPYVVALAMVNAIQANSKWVWESGTPIGFWDS